MTTTYIWDYAADSVLAELVVSGTNTIFTAEPEQYGRVVSQFRSSASYYEYDALGSTRQLTGSAGDVTDSYIYDAWGGAVASTGSTANPLQWNGEVGYYDDLDTGEVYVRARSYSPVTGRWTSMDPAQVDHVSLNAYVYASLSPLLRIDASGEQDGCPPLPPAKDPAEKKKEDCIDAFPKPKEKEGGGAKKIADCMIKCGKPSKDKKWRNCIIKCAGGKLSDELKRWAILLLCCNVNKKLDPCDCKAHDGECINPSEKRPEQVSFCAECCEFQACVFGFDQLGDFKKVLKGTFNNTQCSLNCQGFN